MLAVDAGHMHRAGHRFSVAANGVWTVQHVPPDYLSRLPHDHRPAPMRTDAARPYLGDPDDDENAWRDLRGDGVTERRSAEDLRRNCVPNCRPAIGREQIQAGIDELLDG